MEILYAVDNIDTSAFVVLYTNVCVCVIFLSLRRSSNLRIVRRLLKLLRTFGAYTTHICTDTSKYNFLIVNIWTSNILVSILLTCTTPLFTFLSSARLCVGLLVIQALSFFSCTCVYARAHVFFLFVSFVDNNNCNYWCCYRLFISIMYFNSIALCTSHWIIVIKNKYTEYHVNHYLKSDKKSATMQSVACLTLCVCVYVAESAVCKCMDFLHNILLFNCHQITYMA